MLLCEQPQLASTNPGSKSFGGDKKIPFHTHYTHHRQHRSALKSLPSPSYQATKLPNSTCQIKSGRMATSGTSPDPTREQWAELCREVQGSLLEEMGEESWYLIIVSDISLSSHAH